MELQCLHKLAKRISSFSTPPSSLQPKGLIVILLIAVVSALSNASAGTEDASLNRAQIAVIQKARQGMEATLAYIKQRPDLFPGITPETEHVLSLEDRQEVREIWARFLDYQLSLDSIAQQQDRWQSTSNDADFSLGYASFLTRYRFALDFIELIDNDPAVRIVLNEAIPELGLPERSYADFKFHYLNVAIASRFATLYTLNKAKERSIHSALSSSMQEDEAKIWEAGKGKGIEETASNALQVTKHLLFKTFFPVQKNISEWMGDTRVLKGEDYYVSLSQVEDIATELRPGDILLQRREWFLSNLGLPGFWSHAALYVGTPEERAAYFDDSEVRAWLATQDGTVHDLDTLLKTAYPEAYRHSLATDHHDNKLVVLEAMSEGVVFTSREHLATTDSLAVLRPRLSRIEKAKALLKAFSYSGRPYDFDFDFRTDSQLVCTELVYKAYEPEQGYQGIRFPLRSVAGRPVITANDIANQFDQDYEKSGQQFDLVLFLDGNERDGKAEKAGIERFRASWQRPKWHILTQNTPFASR